MQLPLCMFEACFGIAKTQDIVHMDGQYDDIVIRLSANIYCIIGVGLVVTYFGEFAMQQFVPTSSCLTKTIETSDKTTYSPGTVIETLGLPHIDHFRDVAVQKGSSDVILATKPPVRRCQV